MPPLHQVNDRVREFHNRRIEWLPIWDEHKKSLLQALEEELVLTAWRAGYYFDRAIQITEEPYRNLFVSGSDASTQHICLHLYALGLALPCPEQD